MMVNIDRYANRAAAAETLVHTNYFDQIVS